MVKSWPLEAGIGQLSFGTSLACSIDDHRIFVTSAVSSLPNCWPKRGWGRRAEVVVDGADLATSPSRDRIDRMPDGSYQDKWGVVWLPRKKTLVSHYRSSGKGLNP